MSAITLHIEGMSCGHCLNAVSRASAVLVVAVCAVAEPALSAVANDAAAAVTAAGYRATALAKA